MGSGDSFLGDGDGHSSFLQFVIVQTETRDGSSLSRQSISNDSTWPRE